MTLPDTIGYIGVALILVAYGGLQFNLVSSGSVRYSTLNGLGAAGILVSLYFEPNLPAIIMEAAWLMISLFGLYKAFLYRKA
jgi:hypothetical protein